jgi:hypothetical protein
MATRRALKGALHNFLGTFTSRYSDFDGYWLLGLIEANLEGLLINLSSSAELPPNGGALGFAIELAKEKFGEQLEKAAVSRSWVRESHLQITLSPEAEARFSNSSFRNGHNYRFCARVLTDLARTVEAEIYVYVAPHDPALETRSRRRA